MAGGVYLLMRQTAGVMITGVGLLVLIKIIGATSYGTFAAANALYLYVHATALLGIDVFLLRATALDDDQLNVAATVLLVLGVLGAVLAVAALPIVSYWVAIDGIDQLALAQFGILPVSLMGYVPRALLERELRFRTTATIDLVGMSLCQLTALVSAGMGHGAWALVWGLLAQQLLVSVLLFRSAAYRYRPRWNMTQVRSILRFGVGYCVANWIWQAKTLVNPLIVGRFGGAEAVAFVALAVRGVSVLTIVAGTTWRLSIATMRHVNHDASRMARAVTEAMELQVLAAGPMLVVAGLAAPVLLPLLYGRTWLPVLDIFPFVALAALVNIVFSIHSSALFAAKKNGAVGVFHAVHRLLLATAAGLLVPQLGPVGYGVAELIAVGSYPVIHYGFVRTFRSPDYRLAFLWCAAFGLAPFWHQLGWLSLIGPALLMCHPRTRRVVVGHGTMLATSWTGARLGTAA
jgi:PST family polysaccharide transporter